MAQDPELLFARLEELVELVEEIRSQEGQPLSAVLGGALKSLQAAQQTIGVKAFQSLRAKVKGKKAKLGGVSAGTASVSGELTVT